MGRILGKLRDGLPYGNLRLNRGTLDFEPSTSMSFRKLGALSKHIQLNEVYTNTCFHDKIVGDFFGAFNIAVASTSPDRVEDDVLSNKIRSGFIEVIWRIHECIKFVVTEDPARLNRILDEMRLTKQGEINRHMTYHDTEKRGPDIRESTQEHILKRDVKDWKDMAEKWTQYLEVFDSVFPRVFWDIPYVMGFITQKYPRLFWEEFWSFLAHPSSSRFTEFQEYLVNSVASELISTSAADPRDPHHTFSRTTLQQLLSRMERSPDGEEAFVRLMSRRGMSGGLISTGITMFPRVENLSSQTRDSMDIEEYPKQKIFLPLHSVGQ